MTMLRGLSIWDGEKQLDAETVRISGSVIAAVGEDPTSDSIDCSGLTLIPGLVDAHVHLELNPDDAKAPERIHPQIDTLMAERARGMALAGITTARDLGGGAWHELALRDKIAQRKEIGPRLICSGQPITCSGGHCHFWGGEADSLAEAQSVLKRQIEHDVDLIKIMVTGGRLTPGSEPSDAQFPQSTINGIVEMAHAHARPVAAHCHGTEGIHRAALAGVNTIEHCSWVGHEGWASDYQADVAQVILDNGVWVSPTVNKGWQRMLDSSTDKVLGRVRAAYQKMLAMGIPLVASTDAGIPGVYHADLPQALVVFAKIAELTNEQALRSATSDAAKALGIDQLTGRIKPGYSADLVLLDGNPLEDLTAVTRQTHVFCAGRQIF